MLYISMRLFRALRFGTRKCAVYGSKPWELRVKTMALWGRKPHGFYPEVCLLWWGVMVRTIIFYGTNVHASWYKHWCAKDFRQYPQSLWLMLPKSLAWYPKDFGMANVIPYSTIYYTIEHRTINHIARKFITDKCRCDPNQTKCMVQL
jgi:hypothetical protein